MKNLKPIVPKLHNKQERERQVLLGLVDYYIKTGRPVGSNTLKETGFDNLSSATIRNYFARLDEEGYLSQAHSSGGRVPTNKAYRLYATEALNQKNLIVSEKDPFKDLRSTETKEIASFLLQSAENLSATTETAVFLSAPRFDYDYVVDVKIVSIDYSRCLCVIITDFGVIKTEILPIEKKLGAFSTKRLEAYFHWRLTGLDKPENLNAEEEELAKKFYNELMLRYVVGYTNFSDDEIHRTGFSKLLSYPDFHDTETLAKSLALFENVRSMRLMLTESTKHNLLKFWIGEDLAPYTAAIPECAVITVPYHINRQSVGAIGIIGPVRIPYRQLFDQLNNFSEAISEALTRNIYKFKINFRQPQQNLLDLQQANHSLKGPAQFLLDNKE